MEKQTAVSWLIEQLYDKRFVAAFKNEIEQAKELERQQIVEAFEQGQAKEAKEAFWTKGNEYYNQTFNP